MDEMSCGEVYDLSLELSEGHRTVNMVVSVNKDGNKGPKSRNDNCI
jgi:hypothetical protein